MARLTKAEEFTHRLRETVVTAAVGVLLLMTLLWAIEQLRALLVLLVFSLFCGFALEPAVNKLARRGWSRGRATGLVFLVLAIVLGAFGALLGTIVVKQVVDLVKNLPDYARVARFVRAAAPFTADAGLLTANGRPRRDAILSRYQAEVDACYRQPSDLSPSGVPA